jgi:hypothetical protein
MRSVDTQHAGGSPGAVAVALTVSLWAAAAAAAPERFECAPLSASTSRQPAYGPVPGQARCEGFYAKNVSQPFIEIVSLTRSLPDTWTAASDGRLELRGAGKADTRLLIQPMRSNPLYRVDAALPRGTTLPWNSGTMLQATGLRLRELGFLALVGRGTDPVMLAPVSVPAGDETPSAYAVLRPSVDVSEIAWRSYRPGAASDPSGTWQQLPGGSLFAWERAVLPIALPADGHGLRVDVRALDGDHRPLPMLQFAILGADDEAP